MAIKSKTKKRIPKNRVARKEKSMLEQKIQERLTVGVRELRQDASGVLRLVKNGKSITITEHGKPIAQLTPLVNPVLDDYVNAGVITPAVRKYDPKIDKPLPNPDGIDLVAQLLQDRARI